MASSALGGGLQPKQEDDLGLSAGLEDLFMTECCRDCTIDLVDSHDRVTFNAAMRSACDFEACEVCVAIAGLVVQVEPETTPDSKPFPPAGSMAWQRLRTCYVKLAKRLGGTVSASDLAASWSGSGMQPGKSAASTASPSGTAQPLGPSPRPKKAGSPTSKFPRTASTNSLASPAKASSPDAASGVAESAAASAGLQVEGATAAPPSDDDDDDEDDFKKKSEKAFAFVQGLPMHELGLNGRMPAGASMSNISRMRSTLNDAAAKLSSQRWLQQLRLPALQGLQRRLMARSPSIIGKANVQMEIGFSQMLCRVQCLINLYKLLRQWIDHQSDGKLEDIFTSLDPLTEFLSATDAELAPDLATIVQLATFRVTLKKRGKITEAMKSIDYEAMCKQYEDMQEFNKSSSGLAVPQEPQADASDKDVASAVPSDEKKRKRQQKRQIKKCLTTEQVKAVELRLAKEPHEQFAKLIVDAISSKLYRVRPDSLNVPSNVDALLDELRGVRDQWSSTVLIRHDNPEQDAFGRFMQTVLDLFGCLCEDSQKPSVEAARAARKEVYTQAKAKGSSNAIVELAKAIGTYSSGKVALDAALSHSKMGIEDEAASQGINTAVERFEALLEPAFRKQEAWPTEGNEGRAHTMDSIKPFLDEVRTTTLALFASIGRWSAVALDDSKDLIESTLSNFALVLHISNWVLLESLKDVLVGCFPESVIESVLPSAAPDAELADDFLEDADDTDPARDDKGDGGATAKSKVNMWDITKPIGVAILEFQPKATAYCNMVATVLQEVLHIVGTIEQRTRDDWWSDDFRVKEQLATLSDEAGRNRKSCETLCEYLISMDALCNIDNQVSSQHEASSATNTCSSTSEQLCIFGRIHKLHLSSSVVQFELTDGVCPRLTATVATSLFDTFLVDFGNPTYKEHANAAMSRYMRSVNEVALATSQVHEDVLRAADRAAMLSMLMRQADIDNLVEKSDIDFTATIMTSIQDKVQELPHNQAIEKLKDFTEAIGMDTIKVPQVRQKDGSCDIDVEHALLALRLQAGVVNICIPAVHVHSRFLSAEDCGIDLLCGSVTGALVTMQHELARYDELVNGEVALRMEACGLSLPTSIANLRNWRWLMSLLSGAAQKFILERMAEVLNVAEVACKSAIPSWSACFAEDGRLKETVAAKVLTSDKLKLVVQAHNAVHNIMQMMGASAWRLQVTPRLQDNDITSTAIATARDTLAQASLACTAILGVELICNSTNNAGDLAEAKSFLAKHRQGPAWQALPAGFWAQLEVIAAHVGGAPTAPAAGAAAKTAVVAAAALGQSAGAVSVSATPKGKAKAPRSEVGSDISGPKSSPFKREGDTDTAMVFKRSRRT